jgi:hypothetical protein
MKNKNEIVYRTESEENEEIAENTGEFVDWLLDTIRDRMYKCTKNMDFKSVTQLNDLMDAINLKLEEE